MRSKIHKATVTEADLNYIGSLTVDEDLMDKVGMWPGEKIMIVNNTNGERIETYLFRGERGSGVVCANGAAAHRIRVGDEIIIMGYELTERPIEPRVILVDESNQFKKYL